jgi:hypothetical protein
LKHARPSENSDNRYPKIRLKPGPSHRAHPTAYRSLLPHTNIGG